MVAVVNSELWQKSVSSLPIPLALKFLMNGLNGKVPDKWPQWRCHCEQFRASSGLQDASASKQVNILLYCLEEEAKSMLKSTNITEEETKNYETVLEKFDSFFQVIIVKRARFNHRC